MSRTELGLGLGLVLEMHKTINRPARRTLRLSRHSACYGDFATVGTTINSFMHF